jgi:hypothetical protein
LLHSRGQGIKGKGKNIKRTISAILAVLAVALAAVSCGGGKEPTILEGTWINDVQPEWDEVSLNFSEGIGGIVFGGNKMAVFIGPVNYFV